MNSFATAVETRANASPSPLASTALRAVPLAAAILLLSLSLYAYEPRYLGGPNVANLLRGASFLAVVASGQMLVMIVGGFDLSVGGVAAFSSVVSALSMVKLAEALPGSEILVSTLGVLAGLAAGLVVGAVNGFVVALFGAPPFMVTLGTLSIVSGAAFYLTAGTPVYGLPDLFATTFGRSNLAGASVLVWVSLLVVLLVWILQDLLKFGRHIRAIGSSRHAARLAGVPVRLYLVGVYALSGLFAAVVGVLLTARLGSGQSTIGLELMLQSIAVAVVGGVSLRGGVGRIESIVLSALFFSVVTNGMNLARINSKLQVVVIGLIIIAATLTEKIAAKRIES